ncbi:MAG TPA: type II toxin-antitoxin system ParD family antitoxin [Terracidiphilus sp.]|jgi:putative addiction module CopG family antidote
MMNYRSIHLTPDSHEFVQSMVESGRYENFNALVQAALRALRREEHAAGSGRKTASIAESDVFRKLWENSTEASQLPD